MHSLLHLENAFCSSPDMLQLRIASQPSRKEQQKGMTRRENRTLFMVQAEQLKAWGLGFAVQALRLRIAATELQPRAISSCAC